MDHGLDADDRLLQAHRGGPEKEREQRGDWIAGSQGKVTALSLSPPLDKEGNQHPSRPRQRTALELMGHPDPSQLARLQKQPTSASGLTLPFLTVNRKLLSQQFCSLLNLL